MHCTIHSPDCNCIGKRSVAGWGRHSPLFKFAAVGFLPGRWAVWNYRIRKTLVRTPPLQLHWELLYRLLLAFLPLQRKELELV